MAFERARARMVRQQIQARGITDSRILQALASIPRHRFVDPQQRRQAYADRPLPIGQGQTISQPFIVAKMLEWLELETEDRVLEVGSGSGYQTALLAQLVAQVVSLERIPAFAARARQILDKLVIQNVELHEADGSLGWLAAAPYNAILVSAAAPRVPPALLDQLRDGGRLVIPVGQSGQQRLDRWQRKDGDFVHEQGPPVAFVPLIGDQAWPD